MSDKLREVTYLTVKNLKKSEIVLPGDYSKVFGNYARELNLDISNQNVILKSVSQDIDMLDSVVKQTNENINTLKVSTQTAKIAIENKDTESLNNINNDLIKMQEQILFLEKELFSDSLTKAYNRKWFSDFYLENDKFRENGYLAFIDIDKFKLINDNYGHLLGDLVLKYLVKFLKKELDYEDVNVVRYAGDEFMIIFPKILASKMNIQGVMLNVQEKLSKQILKSGKVSELKFSFSFGLVEFKKADELGYIIEKADEGMYKNKKR